jgi:hypothetical protein
MESLWTLWIPCGLHGYSAQTLNGLYMDSPQTLQGQMLDYFMDCHWTLHGFYVDSTRTIQRLYLLFTIFIYLLCIYSIYLLYIKCTSTIHANTNESSGDFDRCLSRFVWSVLPVLSLGHGERVGVASPGLHVRGARGRIGTHHWVWAFVHTLQVWNMPLGRVGTHPRPRRSAG